MWKSLKNKASFAISLSLMDWLAFIEAWWTTLFFYIALRMTSYERLNERFESHHPANPASARDLELARRFGTLVNASARLHLLKMTCLVHALALRSMLDRRGIFASIMLGANKVNDSFHAHAWVELNGSAIGQSDGVAERFKIFMSIEDGAASRQ